MFRSASFLIGLVVWLYMRLSHLVVSLFSVGCHIMEIPTITEQDLINFHKAHFPNAPLPSRFFHQDEVVNTSDDGPYGLGYYYDGTPRSLTDEDIAYLREREIKAYIKRREKKRDAKRRKEAKQTDTVASQSPASDEVDTTSHQQDHTERSSSCDKEDDVSGGNPPEPLQTTNSSANKKKSQRRKKRRASEKLKKSAKGRKASIEEEEEFTPRRIARELDEAAAVSVELDY